MNASTRFTIYGDSLMKATLPDRSFHYRFTISPYLERLQEMFPIEIRNRAVFGACVDKGEKQLEKDLAGAEIGTAALIEFGGNDCNFRWDEIAASPEGEHLPRTTLDRFLRTIERMADKLLERGIRPILMTLPPIDPHRYLRYIGRDGTNCENILKWLGDTDMIYRFHEMYSNAIEKLAFRRGFQLIDIRSRFLDKHNYRELISEDGIHPSDKGYELIFSVFAEALSSDPVLTVG